MNRMCSNLDFPRRLMRSSTRLNTGSQVSVIDSPTSYPVKGVYIVIGAMFSRRWSSHRWFLSVGPHQSRRRIDNPSL
jgi:hypothetical protein